MSRVSCWLSALCAIFIHWSPAWGEEPARGRWILVAASELRTAAEPLIERRKRQGWEVVVVDAAKHQPADAEGGERLRGLSARTTSDAAGETCVLLLGTWEKERPGARILPASGTQGRMKGQPTDHGFGRPDEDGGVKIAVGRLPARSAAEAKVMIDKTLRFELAKFETNRINLFIAHPGGRTQTEKTIASSVVNVTLNDRLKRLNQLWRPTCVTDISSSKYAVKPGEFGSEIKRLMNGGYLFAVYSGHSYAPAIVSESGVVLRREDFDQLKPTAPAGVLASCGCFGCQIDGPHGQGYCLSAIRSPGGPAAVIGSFDESYSAMGLLAFDGLLSQMQSDDPPRTLGKYWLAAQHGIARGKISSTEFLLHDSADGSLGKVPLEQQRLEHAEMWTLLGDPAMTLPIVPAK